MPASMGVIYKSVASAVIKLIEKSDTQGSNQLESKCWKIIAPCYSICGHWPEKIGHSINYYNQYWRNKEIPKFQMIFKAANLINIRLLIILHVSGLTIH